MVTQVIFVCPSLQNIAAFASDIILGLEPWLNTSTVCTYPAPWEERNDVTQARDHLEIRWNLSRPMTDYEGLYDHPCFGHIIVGVEDNDRLQLEYGRFGKMVLVPMDEMNFLGYFVDKLWFVTNSDGNTAPFNVSFDFQGDRVKEIRFPIDFSQKPTKFVRGTGVSLVSSVALLSLATVSVRILQSVS